MADIGSAGIRDGHHLDQLGIVDGFGFVGSEVGAQINAPMGSQPNQGLGCDDDAGKDKRPLLAVDVFGVTILGEVDGQKSRPDDREGPDICV